jgi:hypothetical protein
MHQAAEMQPVLLLSVAIIEGVAIHCFLAYPHRTVRERHVHRKGLGSVGSNAPL